ncbi:hypothetical protein ACFLWR_00520 [Chloroflexota bacterium]
MKKILVAEDNNDHTLNSLTYTDEKELQDYLSKYPELIPLEEIMDNPPRLVCIGYEVVVPSGYIDLLFIDEDGTLTIVEVKLERNSEIHRKVIGQIMEYASQVSEWSIDDVYTKAQEYLKRPLEDVMREKNEDLSIDLFRENVTDKLTKGDIRLVIAVDEIVEILRTTVTFLNRNSKFELFLLQISCFNDEDNRKILVPLLFGYARRPTIHTLPGQTDRTTFLALCQEGRHTRSKELFEKLEKLSLEREDIGDEIRWGVSGYSYKLIHKSNDTFELPVVGQPDGSMSIRFSLINNLGETGERYLQRLLSIPTIANQIGDYLTRSEQSFHIDAMTSSEVDDYVSALRELGQAIT